MKNLTKKITLGCINHVHIANGYNIEGKKIASTFDTPVSILNLFFTCKDVTMIIEKLSGKHHFRVDYKKEIKNFNRENTGYFEIKYFNN